MEEPDVKDFGKILPVDAFKTYLYNSLPTNYLASLIHLYQPLLGIEAVQMYQFLLLEARIYSNHNLQTHHTLMTYLNRPLDVIYQTRLKLEALGLLKTYQNDTEDKKVYTYVLQAPFSPDVFMQDAMLTELLYREIGESKFSSLRQLYQKDANVQFGTDITVSFNDVYQTVEPQLEELMPVSDTEPAQGAQVEKMDFTYLHQVLLNKMIPAKKILTDINKRVINQLSQLYQLDQYEVEKSLLWALTDENTLDVEQFKAACNDVFQAKYNHNTPQLKSKEVKKAHEEVLQPKTRAEKLTKHLETISPKELLEDLSAGKNASAQDMKMISDIMTKQGLSMPVMNVAIYYCLLQSNMRLSKAYLEKVGSHWSRLGLQTAAQAMKHAQQEIQPKTKHTQRRSYQTKQQTQEVIPDWFEDSKRSTTSEQKKDNKSEVIDDKDRDEMLAILKRHSSNKK